MKFEYALDIGSSHTSIYKKGEGIIFKEPTLISVKGANSNYQMVAIGKDCLSSEIENMENTITFSPFSQGIIKSVDYLALYLKAVFKKIFPNTKYRNYGWYVAVPCGLSAHEKQKYFKIFQQTKLNVELVSSILCSAIGSALDFDGNGYTFLVDIGGSRTDVAIIKNLKIVNGASIGLGGDTIDKAIVQYVKDNFGCTISTRKAEKIKIEIGSLYLSDSSCETIQGIDLETNNVKKFTIYAKDIRACINPIFNEIAKVIKATINECDEKIVEIIKNDTIYITGKSCQFVGTEEFFYNSTGIITKTTQNVENAVIIGLGQILGR